MRRLDPALHEKLHNLIKSMGCEFVGGEMLSRDRQMLLRIYIDRATGATLDDCSLIGRQISAMLDVENPIEGRYVLEVSSPGLDRPLFVLEHYQQQVGKQIKVKLHLPVHQRRQYAGVIQRVEGDQIHLLVEGVENEVIVPYSSIDKANVVADVGFKKSRE